MSDKLLERCAVEFERGIERYAEMLRHDETFLCKSARLRRAERAEECAGRMMMEKFTGRK
jgi:hypothetical protein